MPSARLGPSRWSAVLPVVGVLLLLALPGGIAVAANHAPAGAPHPGPSPARPSPRPMIPVHPPKSRAPQPPGATVDPESLYTAEPAPMGIDDFGVDASGNGYRYTTSAFLGIAEIRSLYVDEPGLGSYEYSLTIQQNVCLEFTRGGTEYQFWIQNVVFINSSADQTYFENNIWNLSANNSGMDSNSVSGNGSVYGGEYYALQATTPGSVVTLSYPEPLEFLVVQSVVKGMPAVAFEYDTGSGWTTYDNVVFPFGAGATGTNFVVDGTQYAPDGLFDDAELILGGPGGGSSTSASQLNMTLSEAYYNGHNFQAIRNAYNFGGDTAETIGGVAASRPHSATNASLGVQLNTGSATLGQVYGDTYSALVTVKTPATAGILFIGTSSPLPFTTSTFTITIAPGTYAFNVDNLTGEIGSTGATIAAGSNSTVTVAASTTYSVTFGEEGLAQDQLNASWAVALGSLTLHSRGTSLQFFMINGTFDYAVPKIPGYLLNGSSGSVVVAGAADLVVLEFVQVVYGVSLYETGLPLGTNWSIGVHGATYYSTSVALHFSLPNGTFTYTLGNVPGWTAAPSAHAKLTIAAGSLTETLSFHPFTYEVLAVESGLPGGALWGVKIGSNLTVGTLYALRLSEGNGSYSYRISPPSGWFSTPSAGTFKVVAANVTLNLTFTPFAYWVNFTAEGLPAGTAWAVNVSGATYRGSNGTIGVLLKNGTYAFRVDPVKGFEPPVPASGSVVVAGSARSQPVQFTPQPIVDGYLMGSIEPMGADLFVNGTAVPFTGTTFNLSLVPGVYALQVAKTGFHPYFGNFTVTPGGRTDVPAIVLTPVSGPPGVTGPSGGGGGTPAPNSLELLGLVALVGGALVVGGLAWWLRHRHA